MEYLGIIGTTIGVIASSYELYTKFLPWTRKTFPDIEPSIYFKDAHSDNFSKTFRGP